MRKRICVFGDSITYGVNDLEMGGWVERFKIFFWRDYDYSIYNFGVSGDTTSDLLKRVNLESESINPEIVVISLGTNDSSFRDSLNHEKVSFENFKKNIEDIYKTIKKYSDKIVFMGLLGVDQSKTDPIPWNTEAHYTEKNIKKYDNEIKEFCNNNNLKYIEMSGVLEKEDLKDGLHPDAKGHEKIFQKVKDYLIENKIIILHS